MVNLVIIFLFTLYKKIGTSFLVKFLGVWITFFIVTNLVVLGVTKTLVCS
jgi:hypothetical protein